MKRTLIFLLAGFILLCGTYVSLELLISLPIDKNIEIEIPKGATFRQAVEILSKEKLVRDRGLFIFVSKISGLDRRIRAGHYSIEKLMTPFDLFRMLRNGRIIEYEVKIREGDSLQEIGEKLSERNIINTEDFESLSSDKEFLDLYNIDAPTLEGYLFPDTYKIPKGMDPTEAIGLMIDRMREKYSGQLRIRTSELGLSEREVLTLASIIEKEAKTEGERYLISAVYHNRLRKGMPLQADPTSIYGIKSSREKITARDLQQKTPYNTYIIKGLPPGPIASPSIKSIIAALYPARVPYIYFVSNNDGTHRFSVTPGEHLSAVRSYREKKQMENKEKINEARRDGNS
ncbi:MAG: endolytic transglycosylase MltG [Nitrospirota bacterium]